MHCTGYATDNQQQWRADKQRLQDAQRVSPTVLASDAHASRTVQYLRYITVRCAPYLEVTVTYRACLIILDV
jgi:hypothetical protein